MEPRGVESTHLGGERPAVTYRPADPGGVSRLTIATTFTDDTHGFADTAKSVLRQSLQDWEWLIAVRGARRDDVLSAIGEPDPRVRFVDDMRGALMESRTEFVLHLPAGDLLEPTAAEKWLWFLISHPKHSAVGSLRGSLSEGDPDSSSHVRGDSGTETDGWAGVSRRAALFSKRTATRATLPERLHWSRAAGVRTHIASAPRAGTSARSGRRSRVRFDPPFRNTLAKSHRRVLLLVPWVTTGGADKFTVDLVGQLRARDWEVTLATTLAGDNSWLPRIAKLTPDVFSLPELLSPTDYPRFVRYLVESRRPDAILISNSLFAYGALPYLRRSAAGIPIVDYCHSVVEGWLNGGYPRLSVDGRRYMDLQLTSSTDLKTWMTERGGDPERIEVCYIGTTVSDRARRPTRIDFGLPEAAAIVLYPCRITREKQPAVFAQTILSLREHRRDLHAVVVGDGPYLEWLRSFVGSHGLRDAVTFTGSVTNDRVRGFMSVSDCVFLPSKFEGISAVLYEAMAEGVPVVGADVGGQRELVTADCGRLIQPGTPSEEVDRYATVLRELIDDRALRVRMGAAGRARIASQFTIERMGERIESLLERVIERAASSPRPLPSEEEARRAALKGVRIASWSSAAGMGPMSWRIRHVVFRGLSVVGMPLYRLGIRLGAHWLEPLKDRLFNALFPKAE